jgi:Domain of unknown function (DUF4055)
MDGDVVKKLDTRRQESADMLDTWQKCRDVREGQTAIHKAGERYLPKLSGQEKQEYDAFKKRAQFYGATSRTIDAFQGMVMRVPPAIDNENKLLEDITAQGNTLFEFIDDILEDALVVGFGGMLVEHTPMVEGITTLAQAQSSGARPYLVEYDAQNILNWKESGGAFTQLVLEESELVDKSEFEREALTIYRALDLDESGNYRQRRFIKSKEKIDEFIQVGNDIYPLMNGAKLREIPFYFIGDCDELPPLIDLVDLNISHYMSTADLENGCHYTGIPQPWLAGVQLNAGETLSIGGTNAWIFSDPSVKAEYLEFTGQGLGALEKRIEAKEKQMAALGAKMLSDTVVAETATGAGLRSTGELSVLSQMSSNVSKVLSRACTFMYQWAGLPEVEIVLNKDYLPSMITPQELIALVQTWQAGAISTETLFWNLQQGEVVDMSVNFEEEIQRIKAMPAPLIDKLQSKQ